MHVTVASVICEELTEANTAAYHQLFTDAQ